MVQVVEGEAKQVQQARLVYPRETIQRLDVLPFAVAYIGLIASHFVTDGMLSTLSLWSIPVLVVSHVLVELSCYWSCAFRVFVAFSHVCRCRLLLRQS